MLIQVKYTPKAYPFTIDWLLERKEKKPSLLEKWSASLEKLTPSEVDSVVLETNRVPADDLKKCFTPDDHIDRQALRTEAYDAIVRQLGTERANHLLDVMVFRTGLPNLDQIAVEDKRVLCRLNPSYPGAWDSLMNAIRDWITCPSMLPHAPQIHLDDVRKAAQWFELHGISEDCKLPRDLILPESGLPDILMKDADDCDRVIEIDGPPGSGKSTLLTWIGRKYEEKGDVVLCHHYFISNTDTTQHRYDPLVVLESYMWQLQGHGLPGEGIDVGSPDPHVDGKLRQWLENSARKLAELNRHLVVVVDGLDHVYHDSDRAKQSLQDVFEVLLPVPEGMRVIIGTQPLDAGSLPGALTSKAPRRKKVNMPRFKVDAMDEWLEEFGNASMGVDPAILDDARMRRDLAAEIVSVSGGLPLGFRLLQNMLKGSKEPPTRYSLQQLPHTLSDDIWQYYSTLWDVLGDPARTILCTITKYPWPWSPQSICECLVQDGYGRAEVQKALADIQHLLSQEPGPLAVFHTSLAWFVEKQPLFKGSEEHLRSAVLRWLRDTAPDTYRRAYLWVMETDAGSPDNLLEKPERSWVVESLQHHMPHRCVAQVLQKSGRLALEKGRFDVFMRRTLLQDYVRNAFDYYEEDQDAIGILLPAHLEKYGLDLADQLLGEVESLGDREVHALCEFLHAHDRKTEARKCIDELRERVVGDKQPDRYRGEIADHAFFYIDTIVGSDNVDPKRLLHLVTGNRERGLSDMVASGIARAVLRHRKVELAHDLLGRSQDVLEQHEKSACFPWLYALLAHEGSCLNSDVPEHELENDVWPNVLCFCMGVSQAKGLDHSFVESVDSEHVFVDDARLSSGIERYQRIVDLYFRFVVDEAHGLDDAVRTFCLRFQHDDWLFNFVCLLAEASKGLLAQVTGDAKHDRIPLYGVFESLDSSPTGTSWEQFALKSDSRQALVYILLLSSLFLSSKRASFVESEAACAVGSQWFVPDLFAELVIELDCVGTWKQSADALVSLIKRESRVDEVDFASYAKRFALCSEFVRLSGHDGSALADMSCECLVSYGHHKDMLMYDLLQSIQALFGSSPAESLLFLKKASRLVLGSSAFTDGDETSELPDTLALVMKSACPQYLLPYYNWLQEREKYRHASYAYACWLGAASLETAWNRALAETVCDGDSVVALQQRAGESKEAQQVLSVVETRFGGLDGIVQPPENESVSPDPRIEERKVDVSAYRTDQLNALLADTRLSPRGDDAMADWLDYWREQGKGLEAAAALSTIPHPMDIGFRTYQSMSAIVGREKGFLWLVGAHRGAFGWRLNWFSEAYTAQLWNEVKERYPQDWRRFIVETIYNWDPRDDMIGTTGMTQRLTRYLILQGQTEAATDLVRGACTLLAELIPQCVSLDLPRLDFLEDL